MSRRAPRAVLPTALAVLLAGCAGQSPPAHFYTLSAEAPPPASAAPSGLRIAVRDVTVPEWLNRPQIVTRSGANELLIDEFNRWGGALSEDIALVLAQNLTRLLDAAYVTAPPAADRVPADYVVELQVLRLDGAPGGEVTLHALWWLERAPERALLAVCESMRTEPVSGPDYAALVAAQSRALAALSRHVAGVIAGHASGGRAACRAAAGPGDGSSEAARPAQ